MFFKKLASKGKLKDVLALYKARFGELILYSVVPADLPIALVVLTDLDVMLKAESL